MKPINLIAIVVLTALILGCAAVVSAQKIKDNSKDIASLWKEYDKASSKDTPKTALAVLQKIKTLSLESRSSWDYYRASKLEYEKGTSINWRKRDSLSAVWRSAIRLYNDPMMTVQYMLDSGKDSPFNVTGQAKVSITDYIKSEKTRLMASSSPEFMAGNASMMGELRPLFKDGTFFGNDYLKALAIVGQSRRHEEAVKLLKQETEGTYPEGAVAEYIGLSGTYWNDSDERKAEFAEFANKYKGKAVSTLAKSKILDIKFNDLNSKGTSAEYKSLFEEVKVLQSECKSFSGIEKTIASCCNLNLLNTLQGQSVSMSIRDRVAEIVFQNVPSVKLTMKDETSGKSLWNTTVSNPVNSFYRRDTLKVSIPSVSDGEYEISLDYGQKVSDRVKYLYHQYSISLATRVLGDKYQIYAANYLTGEPLGNVSGIEMDGFTDLPDSVTSRLKKNYRETFQARVTNPDGTVWLSRKITKSSFQELYRQGSSDFKNAVVLTDCGAFHPGDTVKFKVVGYSSHMSAENSSRSTLASGTPIKVVIRDADYEKIWEKEFVTNEFGSIDGEFTFPKDKKNGTFWIEALDSPDILGSASVYVGDYVLPTFDVVLDPQKEFVYVGDDVKVTGKVKTYSGRNFSAKSASYRVSSTSEEQNLDIKADGSFEIIVPKATSYFNVSVSVTDATGETKTASRSVSVIVSPYMNADVLGSVDDATCVVNSSQNNRYMWNYTPVVGSDKLDVEFSSAYPVDAVFYKVISSSDAVVASGETTTGKHTILLPGSGAGLFTLETYCTYKGRNSAVSRMTVLMLPEKAVSIDEQIEHVIVPGEGLSARVGSTSGAVWAVATLYSSDGEELDHKLVHLDGRLGTTGSLTTVTFDRKPSYKGPVRMDIFWFRNSSNVQWSHEYDLPQEDEKIDIEFSLFTDKTSASAKTTFTLKVDSSSENTVTVFDKASLSMNWLDWPLVYPVRDYGTYPMVSFSNGTSSQSFKSTNMTMRKTLSAGSVAVLSDYIEAVDEAPVMMESVALDAKANRYASKSANGAVVEDGAYAETEEAAVDEDIQVRSDLLDVLYFAPYLYPDKDGNLSVTFTPSGKLSTYIVKVYSHDKSMRTASKQREIVVSIPVEVSLATPAFLYEGDKYVLHASVSAEKESEITEGRMTIVAYDSSDDSGKEITRQTKKVSLKDGVGESDFTLSSFPSSESGKIAFKVTFSAETKNGEKVSDGILVNCPVLKTQKMMTESHSAVLLAGQDRQALESLIKSKFTNLKSSDAVRSEKTIAYMVGDVLDADRQASYDDAISLMEAIVVRCLSAKLTDSHAYTDDLVKSLLACRVDGGGFSWREGMQVSDYVTAYILRSAAVLRQRGCLPASLSDLNGSVEYLDKTMTDSKRGYFPLGVDLYCMIRSQYLDVPFKGSLTSSAKKEISDFLSHKDGKRYTGDIILKARRVIALDNLSGTDEGLALAKAWGVSLGTQRKIDQSRKADIETLTEYAEKHPMGGVFFPNAVMPFRGLLESELEAHSLLVDVFKYENPSLADSIRLWIMLQKETQQWASDPSCVIAVASVMEGSVSLLETKVVTFTATKMQKFSEVKAAGNAMTIDAGYEVMEGDTWVPVKDGQILKVGQRVRGVYTIFSEQNRSLVVVDLPRPACLLPVNQKSGPVWMTIGSSTYRDVRNETIRYWYNVFPEEKSKIVEEYTVTQEGEFRTPSSEVVCKYVPAWRANTAARAVVKTVFE